MLVDLFCLQSCFSSVPKCGERVSAKDYVSHLFSVHNYHETTGARHLVMNLMDIDKRDKLVTW